MASLIHILNYNHKFSKDLKSQSAGSSGPSMLSLQLFAAKSITCIGMGAFERVEKNTFTLGLSKDSVPGSTTTARRCEVRRTSEPMG